MRYDLIEKVEFCPLRSEKESYDRRGTIAVFHLKDIPNKGYLYTQTAIAIRKIIALLGDTYDMDWSDPRDVESYAIGEAQDCWLNHSYNPRALVLNHKYWGSEQVDAFYKFLEIMAKLHKWEIVDKREGEGQNG